LGLLIALRTAATSVVALISGGARGGSGLGGQTWRARAIALVEQMLPQFGQRHLPGPCCFQPSLMNCGVLLM
jgi:hypothetical protein